MSDTRRVLWLNADATLLRTQVRLLHNTEFALAVTACTSSDEAELALMRDAFDLFVIAHTISRQERERLAEFCKVRHSHARVLVLHRSAGGPASFADDAVDSRDGPAVVLGAVNRLLGSARVMSKAAGM